MNNYRGYLLKFGGVTMPNNYFFGVFINAEPPLRGFGDRPNRKAYSRHFAA